MRKRRETADTASKESESREGTGAGGEGGSREEARAGPDRGAPGIRGDSREGEPDPREEAHPGDSEREGNVGTDEVTELREELARLNDRHLRLAAEFDNFRKRSQSQLGESGTRAQADLVGKLLEVVDDFERISSLERDQASGESVLEGVEMVDRKLRRILEDAGLEAVQADGASFDPNSMEAMMKEPAESPEEDETVARVLQPGFRFRGQLLRPARVSVRKYED